MFRQLRKLSASYHSEFLTTDHSTEILIFKDTHVEVKRRAHKRSIGITLQVNGRIKVSAPKSAPLKKIKEFLETNDKWISSHLQRYEELRRRYPPKRYVENEMFLFMGERAPLQFMPRTGTQIHVMKVSTSLRVEVPRERLAVIYSQVSHPEVVRAVIGFYEHAGRTLLASRVKAYSERMGLFPSGLSFRSQKTRWGSCSSQGRVSLNWRLVVAPLPVIDYVVVHELAHLKYYNHSKAFWSLVAQQLPEYTKLRNWLKEHQYEADFLARESELHPRI